MPLPVPYHQVIVPPVRVDPNYLPFIPQLALSQDGARLLPMVVASVINTMAEKVYDGPARTFCYNLLVNNNFNNPSFAEVCQQATSLCEINYRKGASRMLEFGIQDAVTQVLTLFTSSLIFQYHELKSVCDPKAVDAAYQNSPVYQNLKNEIQAMHNNQHYGAPQLQSQFPHPSQGHPQPGPGWNGQPVYQQGHPQGYPPQPMYPGYGAPQPGFIHGAVQQVGYGYPQQQFQPYEPYQQNRTQNPRWNGNPNQPSTSGGSGGWGQPGSGVQRVDEHQPSALNAARQDRFMGHLQSKNIGHNAPENHHVNVVNMPSEIEEVSPAQQSTGDDNTLTIEGGSEMNREQHAVAYFGEVLKDSRIIRNTQHQKAANELAITSAIPIEVESEEEVDPTMVSTAVQCGAAEGTVATCAHLEYLVSREKNPDLNLFRIFGRTMNPFMGPNILPKTMSDLTNAPSLINMALKIKSIAAGNAITSDSFPSDHSHLAFLKFVDRQITGRINDFLKYQLQQSMSIDSFVEDIEALGPYLEKKNQSLKYRYAFERWCTEFMQRFLDSCTPEFDRIVSEDFEIPEPLSYGYIPLTASYTFTHLSIVELGYKINGDYAEIDASTAPALFKIAKSLLKHKKELDVDTDVDYLVTSDGCRFRLFSDYVRENVFLIASE